MLLPNDAFGRSVNLTSDGIVDTYSVGSGLILTYPTGTALSQVYSAINSSVPPMNSLPLGEAQALQLSLFQQAVQSYVTNAYSLDTRFNLYAIYQVAISSGLTNRAAYIFQLFSWANAVTQYCASYIAAIEALADSPAVASTPWDLSQISVPDPKITPIAALTIPD